MAEAAVLRLPSSLSLSGPSKAAAAFPLRRSESDRTVPNGTSSRHAQLGLRGTESSSDEDTDWERTTVTVDREERRGASLQARWLCCWWHAAACACACLFLGGSMLCCVDSGLSLSGVEWISVSAVQTRGGGESEGRTALTGTEWELCRDWRGQWESGGGSDGQSLSLPPCCHCPARLGWSAGRGPESGERSCCV